MPFQPAKRSFDLDYHREPPRIRCVGDGPRWTTSLIAGNYVEQSGMTAVELAQQGVFCGAVPHAGLGIALKCDDGATRASEAAMAALMASLPVWTDAERQALKSFAETDLSNWRKIHVGDVHAAI